jgi:hypothetical protein
MSCRRITAYYSVDSNVYHVCQNCTLGDNIEADKRESGKPGSRKMCQRCKDIIAGRVSR